MSALVLTAVELGVLTVMLGGLIRKRAHLRPIPVRADDRRYPPA